MSKAADIYLRVSSVDQLRGTSMESQEADARALAARQGLTVRTVYREQGESAKTADRTELQRLLRIYESDPPAMLSNPRATWDRMNDAARVPFVRALWPGGLTAGGEMVRTAVMHCVFAAVAKSLEEKKQMAPPSGIASADYTVVASLARLLETAA